jgi:hypothetical protein
MKSQIARLMGSILLSTLAVGLVALPCLAADPADMIAHDVYFALADSSPEAQQKFVVACQKFLAGHPGTIWFAAGPLATELQGDLNDKDFSVALHLVFKDKAALEAYAKSERHQQFIVHQASVDLQRPPSLTALRANRWRAKTGPMPVIMRIGTEPGY